MNKWFKPTKQILVFIMSAVIITIMYGPVLSVPVHAQEKASTSDVTSIADEFLQTQYINARNDICLDNISILNNGFFAISEKIDEVSGVAQESTSQVLRAFPDKTTTARFTHNIYDRNGSPMATLTTTVTGLYSQVDGGSSQMLSISGNFSGQFANDFSYTTSISGNIGTIYLYFNGASAGSFSYRINPNGHIERI